MIVDERAPSRLENAACLLRDVLSREGEELPAVRPVVTPIRLAKGARVKLLTAPAADRIVDITEPAALLLDLPWNGAGIQVVSEERASELIWKLSEKLWPGEQRLRLIL